MVWLVFIQLALTSVWVFIPYLVGYIVLWRNIDKDERKYDE